MSASSGELRRLAGDLTHAAGQGIHDVTAAFVQQVAESTRSGVQALTPGATVTVTYPSALQARISTQPFSPPGAPAPVDPAAILLAGRPARPKAAAPAPAAGRPVSHLSQQAGLLPADLAELAHKAAQMLAGAS